MEETNIPGKTKDEMAGRVATSRCLWDFSKRLRSRGHTPRERKEHGCIESPPRRRSNKSGSPWMTGRKLTCEDDERGGGRCDGGRDGRCGRRE